MISRSSPASVREAALRVCKPHVKHIAGYLLNIPVLQRDLNYYSAPATLYVPMYVFMIRHCPERNQHSTVYHEAFMLYSNSIAKLLEP